MRCEDIEQRVRMVPITEMTEMTVRKRRQKTRKIYTRGKRKRGLKSLVGRKAKIITQR